jgi:RNA polymerase sigma-70 factor (ECF subfamily)
MMARHDPTGILRPSGEPSSAAAGPAPEDAALVERVRDGDRNAFGALVERHGGALLRFAQAFVRDRPAAEEVVQDSWLAALEGIGEFQMRSSFKTWMFRIVANRAKTVAARAGRMVPFSALGPADSSDEPAVDPERFDDRGMWRDPPEHWAVSEPERLALGAETRRVMEAAIAGLPAAQRAVITLRDMEELETAEICNLLDITVTNQRVLLHRARARVRRALERYMRGGR